MVMLLDEKYEMLAKAVAKLEFNQYHLIRTPVFTSFRPPSAESEASRMGGRQYQRGCVTENISY